MDNLGLDPDLDTDSLDPETDSMKPDTLVFSQQLCAPFLLFPDVGNIPTDGVDEGEVVLSTC